MGGGAFIIARRYDIAHSHKQNLAAKAEDKEQLFDAKRFASAARDSLLDVRGVTGPPARGGGLRSFPGGLPQQTVASVDHREGDTATI